MSSSVVSELSYAVSIVKETPEQQAGIQFLDKSSTIAQVKGLAAEAGLSPGDRIIAVNGISTHNKGANQIAEMIRSSKGELKIQAETAALACTWPDLYEEISGDIVILSEYLVFEMAEIFSIVADKTKAHIEHQHEVNSTHASSSPTLSFTPFELKTVIGDNIKCLSQGFDKFKEPSQIYKRLRKLESKGANGWRSYTIDYYDDYIVTKDSVDKLIILTFLGTTGSKHVSIWGDSSKRKAEVNSTLGEKPEKGNYVEFNSGFYDFLFDDVFDNTCSDTETSTTKYAQIVSILKILLSHYPDYKLYVTGHSTGGALAQICSFYLAYEKDITIPISCISYGSPRVGDRNFLNAVQSLEQESKLRMIRVVYDKDAVTKVPSIGYAHVGFEVMLFTKENKVPLLTYPNLSWGLWTWAGIAWRNSFLGSLDQGPDRLVYSDILNFTVVKEYLAKFELDNLYENSHIVGYEQIE